MQIKKVSNDDLECILRNTESSFQKMSGANIFISGGTGFFGKWLVQALLYANIQMNLNLKITVLTRNKIKSLAEQSWLSNSVINIIEGDIKSFKFPEEKFDYIIHAATEASAAMNDSRPEDMADTIIDGTRHVLKLSTLSDNPRFLFISSGAVYGSQPPMILKADENLETGPQINNIKNAYAEAKRMAELYCKFYESRGIIHLSIARCFAFVGPYLPMDSHFAVGNFMKNVMEDKPIELTGSGAPYRSYMYPTDLIEWLIVVLCKGQSGEAYNVGSDEEIQIINLAHKIDGYRTVVGKYKPECSVIVNTRNTNNNISREAYVPSIEKAEKNLDLKIKVSLDDAILKTLKWNIENWKEND